MRAERRATTVWVSQSSMFSIILSSASPSRSIFLQGLDLPTARFFFCSEINPSVFVKTMPFAHKVMAFVNTERKRDSKETLLEIAPVCAKLLPVLGIGSVVRPNCLAEFSLFHTCVHNVPQKRSFPKTTIVCSKIAILLKSIRLGVGTEKTCQIRSPIFHQGASFGPFSLKEISTPEKSLALEHRHCFEGAIPRGKLCQRNPGLLTQSPWVSLRLSDLAEGVKGNHVWFSGRRVGPNHTE